MHKKVFIADDDVNILEAVEIILSDEGFLVLSANNGESIVEEVQYNQPDLVLLDLWLNGIDGQSVAKELLDNPYTRNVPIVIVSANTKIAEIASVLKVADYLEKPFDVDDLINIVKKYTLQ